MGDANDYHFLTRWHLQGNAEKAYDLLSHPSSYERWWKPLDYQTEVLEPGEPSGVGKKIKIKMKGQLPYSLSWQQICIEAKRPERIVFQAGGDLCGTGEWSIREDASKTGFLDITFDWRVRAQKKFLQRFSFLLKPFFSFNHDRVMSLAEKGLQEDLKC